MNVTSTVNMTQVAEAYYAIGNPTIVPYSYEIKEKSLSGNMDIQEMLDRKLVWKTEDDHLLKASATKMDRGEDFGAVKLEPQRIRVFNIQYTIQG